MDTSTGLCLRDTLYTVYTTLIFELRVCPLSINHEADILHTTDTNLLHVHGLDLPTLCLRIMYIHAVDFCCKKCCLIATGTWGLVTGIAIVKSGLSETMATLMTLLVYAGSAQLTAEGTGSDGMALGVALAEKLLEDGAADLIDR